MRVFVKAAIAFTSILPLNSGYTQAIEDTTQMLSSIRSSYGFVYLLEPTFSVKQPRHKLKQLFSDVVHLNQRGLAILLRRIISFLPRSQRQLPHTKLTRQQRPGGDNVKSACDAAVRKRVGLTTNARSPQGQPQSQPQRWPPVTSASLPCRYQTHEIVHWHSCYPPATPRRPVIAGRWCCCDPRFS